MTAYKFYIPNAWTTPIEDVAKQIWGVGRLLGRCPSGGFYVEYEGSRARMEILEDSFIVFETDVLFPTKEKSAKKK